MASTYYGSSILDEPAQMKGNSFYVREQTTSWGEGIEPCLKLTGALCWLFNSYKKTTKSTCNMAALSLLVYTVVKDKFLAGTQLYFPQLIIFLISRGPCAFPLSRLFTVLCPPSLRFISDGSLTNQTPSTRSLC